MEQYKLCNTNQRPCPGLKVSSEEFTNTWRQVWENRNSDMTELFTISQDFITYWEQLLTNPRYPKDINYITLCTRLNWSPKKATKMIKLWILWCQRNTSVREEITFQFIKHVRTANYFPKKASPLMAEYVIVDAFKNRIKDNIIHACRQMKKAHIYDDEFLAKSNVSYEDLYPDYLALKNLDLTPFETYLFEYIKLGYELTSMESSLQIARKFYMKEGKQIWDKLKTIYSDQ